MYWLYTKKCLEAAEIAVNLYALPIPLLQHSPLGICGITLSTLANLSACAYVLQGAEWYRTRDRVRLGLGALKKFGEVWATSRWTEKETKKIARSVFEMPRPGMEVPVEQQHIPHGHAHHAVQNSDFRMMSNEIAVGLKDMGGLDYLAADG